MRELPRPLALSGSGDRVVVGLSYTLKQVFDVLSLREEEALVVAPNINAEEVLERSHVLHSECILEVGDEVPEQWNWWGRQDHVVNVLKKIGHGAVLIVHEDGWIHLCLEEAQECHIAKEALKPCSWCLPEHQVDELGSGMFNHGWENLSKFDAQLLVEHLDDPTSFVALEGAVGVQLMFEDPCPYHDVHP